MSALDTPENVSNAQVAPEPVPDAAVLPAGSAPAPTEAPNGEAPAEPAAETPAWFVKETAKLRRQRAESERRADRLASEIEALKRAPSQTAQPKSTELKSENFPNYDAYQEAKTRAAVREELQAAEQLRSQSEVERAALRQREAFIEKASAQAEEAGIDLEEVMETLRGQPIVSQAVVTYLAEAEHSARLAEYLAENPAELERISRLGPALAKKALVKAEASFGAKPKPNATNAPPPPPKVGGRSVNQADWRKSENMDEYAANWEREREERLKG